MFAKFELCICLINLYLLVRIWIAVVCPSSTGSITLVSSLRKNFLLHSSYLPLGVSQRTCDLYVSSIFSGAVAGDLRRHLIQQISSPVNITSFLAPLPGIWGTTWSSRPLSPFRRQHNFLAPLTSSLLQGESLTSNLFTFLLSCLVYFYFLLFVFFIKKYKKISYLFFILLFRTC